MAKMTGFVFQDEYLSRLSSLEDSELGKLIRALSHYHATGEVIPLVGRESVAFDFIRVDIDRIEEKYAARCETNRNNRQRSATRDNDGKQSSRIVPKVKEKEKGKEKDECHHNDDDEYESVFGKIELDPVIIEVQKELNGLTQSHYDDLEVFRRDLPDDLVIEAINEAVAHGVRSWAYVRTILQSYIRNGIKSVGEARARSDRRKSEAQANTKAKENGWNYKQRQYSEEELEGRTDAI